MSGGPVRLQKLLATAGVGSRRRCEALIREGRVAVNGVAITKMGYKAPPGARIEVDGAAVPPPAGAAGRAPFVYILLNKPAGVISSAKDQFGRKTVVDLVRGGTPARVYPVGRLDYGTSGLIVLTDDGDYAYRASHPKFAVDKVYEVTCDRPLPAPAVELLRGGITLDDGSRASPAAVEACGCDPRKLTVVIHEGKNRQVRRMIESAGGSVASLARTAIGGLSAGGLGEGDWRFMGREEAEMVFAPRQTNGKPHKA